MRVMILAAGLGERMRPLTNHVPKPLLRVGGRCLIEYHLDRLITAGFTEIVINLAYLGSQIEQALGNGQRYGVCIDYSYEGSEPLGTAGGIIHALPLLGDSPFLVINSDIWCDYPLNQLSYHLTGLAHLILVDNPDHHPQGDFCLVQQPPPNPLLSKEGERMITPLLVKEGQGVVHSYFTFSGIGIYHPQLFKHGPVGKSALAPLLIQAMQSDQVTGEHYRGKWIDVGTPERLRQLDFDLTTFRKLSSL
ncbi:MAG: hypothetical protein BWK79_07290 [Beggiatoa sp. IS2]|nr:MAG: hypothetical protein BWK79_07290 [Beggiatoa sp. IS2]